MEGIVKTELSQEIIILQKIINSSKEKERLFKKIIYIIREYILGMLSGNEKMSIELANNPNRERIVRYEEIRPLDFLESIIGKDTSRLNRAKETPMQCREYARDVDMLRNQNITVLGINLSELNETKTLNEIIGLYILKCNGEISNDNLAKEIDKILLKAMELDGNRENILSGVYNMLSSMILYYINQSIGGSPITNNLIRAIDSEIQAHIIADSNNTLTEIISTISPTEKITPETILPILSIIIDHITKQNISQEIKTFLYLIYLNIDLFCKYDLIKIIFELIAKGEYKLLENIINTNELNSLNYAHDDETLINARNSTSAIRDMSKTINAFRYKKDTIIDIVGNKLAQALYH